jgi:uncharacterized protein with PIN domain
LTVIDSSGWLEIFSDGPHADEFAARLRNPANVLTPTVALSEVYKVAKGASAGGGRPEPGARLVHSRLIDGVTVFSKKQPH